MSVCHDTQTTSVCVIQTERIYLLEESLCVCIGDCACCLHSLSLKVQSICLGTWKKKSSQSHNRSEPHKRSFQRTYSALWPFLFSKKKKNFLQYILRDVLSCLFKLSQWPLRTCETPVIHSLIKMKTVRWKDQVERSVQTRFNSNAVKVSMQAR